MNKRILLSGTVIIAVVSATFLITRAFFTDTETSTGSTFTVGTLDLEVGGANGTNVEPFVMENLGETSDLSGSKTWTVNNSGSLPGRLYFKINSLVNYENGCNEPEQLVDSSCSNAGAGEGELGNVVNMLVYLDGVQVASSTLATANQDVIGTTWNGLSPVVIPAGGSKAVKTEWSTNKDAYGNEIQSDSLSYDIQFDLVQLETTPTP